MNQRLRAMELAASSQRDLLTRSTARISRVLGVPMTPRQDYGTTDTLRFTVGYAPPRNILDAKFSDGNSLLFLPVT